MRIIWNIVQQHLPYQTRHFFLHPRSWTQRNSTPEAGTTARTPLPCRSTAVKSARSWGHWGWWSRRYLYISIRFYRMLCGIYIYIDTTNQICRIYIYVYIYILLIYRIDIDMYLYSRRLLVIIHRSTVIYRIRICIESVII